MRLSNETITVFNRRINPTTRMETYVPTIIRGVSWYCHVRSNVGDKGLNAANEYTIRIPVDADFGGKTYVDQTTYKNETMISGLFTLASDDIVVKGEVDGPVTPAMLHENNADCFTILGVTDNRRAPNAKHFRVVGS